MEEKNLEEHQAIIRSEFYSTDSGSVMSLEEASTALGLSVHHTDTEITTRADSDSNVAENLGQEHLTNLTTTLRDIVKKIIQDFESSCDVEKYRRNSDQESACDTVEVYREKQNTPSTSQIKSNIRQQKPDSHSLSNFESFTPKPVKPMSKGDIESIVKEVRARFDRRSEEALKCTGEGYQYARTSFTEEKNTSIDPLQTYLRSLDIRSSKYEIYKSILKAILFNTKDIKDRGKRKSVVQKAFASAIQSEDMKMFQVGERSNTTSGLVSDRFVETLGTINTTEITENNFAAFNRELGIDTKSRTIRAGDSQSPDTSPSKQPTDEEWKMIVEVLRKCVDPVRREFGNLATGESTSLNTDRDISEKDDKETDNSSYTSGMPTIQSEKKWKKHSSMHKKSVQRKSSVEENPLKTDNDSITASTSALTRNAELSSNYNLRSERMSEESLTYRSMASEDKENLSKEQEMGSAPEEECLSKNENLNRGGKEQEPEMGTASNPIVLSSDDSDLSPKKRGRASTPNSDSSTNQEGSPTKRVALSYPSVMARSKISENEEYSGSAYDGRWYFMNYDGSEYSNYCADTAAKPSARTSQVYSSNSTLSGELRDISETSDSRDSAAETSEPSEQTSISGSTDSQDSTTRATEPPNIYEPEDYQNSRTSENSGTSEGDQEGSGSVVRSSESEEGTSSSSASSSL